MILMMVTGPSIKYQEFLGLSWVRSNQFSATKFNKLLRVLEIFSIKNSPILPSPPVFTFSELGFKVEP